ncbi:hypothetical protein PT974_06346 [Cladobotryum mycophilum]|uniref:Tyrosine-protein phosphatase non-receptor type 6 n=1 Tax=Cladobotryum mycophilum TaxID=491253 RepID=A0ABR0SL70_9HYPO
MNSVHSLIDAPPPAPAPVQSPAQVGSQVGPHIHDQVHDHIHSQSARLTSPTPNPNPNSAPVPAPAPVGTLSLSPVPAPASAPTPIHTPRPDDMHSRHQGGPPTPSTIHYAPIASPPLRQDTSSSISTQATTATLASTETNNTSYSADTSPNLHQSIFSLKDGSDVSNSRRTSRRRTGPLSQQSRERAALIRKLGACGDCRRRRVAKCHPSHHSMTWEDVVNKFHRSHSPTIQDIAPSLAASRPLSPVATLSNVQPMFTHDPQEMEIDNATPSHHQPGRPPLSEARIRTPLPSGPRLEKSLSLPGIETLKNDIQNNASRMLLTSSRGRYNSVQALLLFWQDDDDQLLVQSAVRELAEVFDKYYHYTFQIQTIPSSSEGCKSSWRWLSRKLNDFAEDRDQRDVLKIVYYVGHTYLDGNREMVLASSRDHERASTIRWGGIQHILEEACADTLIIMDAAYYPSSRMVRQQGVLELIAASMSDEHYTSLDRCVFTRILAEQLRTRAARQSPLSAAELHSILLATYPKMVRDMTPEKEVLTSFPAPLHTMMSGNSRLPSIFLSPVPQNSPLRNSFSYENNPQLHLLIKLNDENIDVESWNEWLRMMPEGIKDIKVEGPFRTSFR